MVHWTEPSGEGSRRQSACPACPHTSDVQDTQSSLQSTLHQVLFMSMVHSRTVNRHCCTVKSAVVFPLEHGKLPITEHISYSTTHNDLNLVFFFKSLHGTKVWHQNKHGPNYNWNIPKNDRIFQCTTTTWTSLKQNALMETTMALFWIEHITSKGKCWFNRMVQHQVTKSFPWTVLHNLILCWNNEQPCLNPSFAYHACCVHGREPTRIPNTEYTIADS